MANLEHLKILEQGVKAWNKWRRENPSTEANFNGAEFTDRDLSGVNLIGASLRRTVFVRVNLHRAFLGGADLTNAKFFTVNLSEANLSNTTLVGTDFVNANLNKADLSYTFLAYANFSNTYLTKTNLKGAIMGVTNLGNIDLSSVRGLETIKHGAPSTIGIDTMYISKGNIPEKFLKGVGVPDIFVEYIKKMDKISPQYYSCFISYSNKDQSFAERLYNDLQNEGVRCWFAPEDMKIGDKILDRIEKEISDYDLLLVVLSENSINSEWVEIEVKRALEKEKKQNRAVLFPIRIDNAVWETTEAWASLIRGDRHIGDFRSWRDLAKYKKAFDKLLHDLKAEEKKN